MSEIVLYQDLDVWKQSRTLVKQVYELTRLFPKDELYGMTSQIRRATISVPSNIAEGCGRSHVKESLQFFFVARGSLYEMETQILLAFDLEWITQAQMDDTIKQVTRCKKLLNGFIKYFQGRADINKGHVHEALASYGSENLE